MRLVEETIKPKRKKYRGGICDDCGRFSRDGGSRTHSFCGACEKTVPYPQEDKCPACGEENHMLIACTACGGRYREVGS